jgi:hypothetical protein
MYKGIDELEKAHFLLLLPPLYNNIIYVAYWLNGWQKDMVLLGPYGQQQLPTTTAS